jgi:DNA excision repair protein ERCC-2
LLSSLRLASVQSLRIVRGLKIERMQPGPLKTLDYSVAVRTLCDFAARQGDLDLRFTPSPTSQEGVDGHRTVASRRRAGYQSEVALSGRYKNLTVRGRADGYDASAGLLE